MVFYFLNVPYKTGPYFTFSRKRQNLVQRKKRQNRRPEPRKHTKDRCLGILVFTGIFSALRVFRKFLHCPFNVIETLQQTGFSKSPKGTRFYNFRHRDIFQNEYLPFKNFVLSVNKHATFEFLGLCSDLFLSKPLDFARNETLCEHRELLRVFGTMRSFPKIGMSCQYFFLFSVERKVVSEFMREFLFRYVEAFSAEIFSRTIEV